MTDKVYIVTDLGPGDGGKGGVVHAVATKLRAHTIIKRGGAQGSHGVHTSKGEKFAFSQWGCGTLDGIPTYLSDQMIVSPIGLLNEAEALRSVGVFDPFSLLTADSAALCATPYHGIASRIKELSLGENPRGTVGTGVGEAYRAFRSNPDNSILVGDLGSSSIAGKLAYVREEVCKDLYYLIEQEYLPADRATLAEEVGLLNSDEFFDYCVTQLTLAGKLLRKADSNYLTDNVLARPGCAVIETSHGVLTDRVMGFHPHTSAIRTLPGITKQLLESVAYQGQVVNLGVSRAYTVRHGAGPIPTYDPVFTEALLPGSAKEANRYQGEIRAGALDLVLLKYAIEVCGGPSTFDGLAITWLDQVMSSDAWLICDSYSQGSVQTGLISPSGEIVVHAANGDDGGIRQHQRALSRALFAATPNITREPVAEEVSQQQIVQQCQSLIGAALGVPVRMTSFGPTEQHKLFH